MKSSVKILEAFNKPLVSEDIEIPQLEQGQILVKLKAAGICGSDVHMWRGEDPRTPLPLILGHEGVGAIADIKDKKYTVDGIELKTGDRIIWNRGVTCGECWYCTVVKEPSLCTNRIVYGINVSRSVKPYLNGCYAEYLVLRAKTDIMIIDDSIDPAVLVSASCSGATAAHAFDYVEGSLLGQTVVIQGAGPLGVYAVGFARSLGAQQIMVIEGNSLRLELCKEFGATHLLNIQTMNTDERRAMVMDYTNGRGADIVIEAVGMRGVAEEGVKLVRKGGRYISTGYAQPAGKEQLDFYSEVVNKNIRIQGVWVSDTSHLQKAVSLTLDHSDTFSKLVTHRFSLDEADEALAVMRGKEALKTVIVS